MAVLCCPLSQDPVAGSRACIQSLSLQCLAKLSAVDPLLSQVVVSCGILDGVMASMAHEHAPVQASASNVLSAVTGSGPEYAKKVLKSGVMPALLNNLQSSNLLVKEAAVNTLATLIESSPDHAALVCTEHVLSGSPRTLLLALVVCLSHVAAKSAALSEALVTKHGVLKPLTAFVQGANTPPDIKAASLNASAQLKNQGSTVWLQFVRVSSSHRVFLEQNYMACLDYGDGGCGAMKTLSKGYQGRMSCALWDKKD
eukprot:scaffold160953_cov20-Tisochrysis_lutea.AAC.1